jgi:hypothetical protein
MTPIEFVLWLNGAAELVGDQPPTPEQWATMREKLGETVGGLVAARLLERAEETLRADEAHKRRCEALRKSQYTPHLGLSIDLPVGTSFDAPESPKPHNPGLLNRILGKTTT